MAALAYIVDITSDATIAPSTNDPNTEALSEKQMKHGRANHIATFAEARERIAQHLSTTIVEGHAGELADILRLPPLRTRPHRRGTLLRPPQLIRKRPSQGYPQTASPLDAPLALGGGENRAAEARRKATAERKIREREAFVRAILDEIREADREVEGGGGWNERCTAHRRQG